MLTAVTVLERHVLMLRRANADPRLRGAPFAVYFYLSDELNMQDFRPKKVESIMADVHMKNPTAKFALRRLIATGYLEPGPKIDRVRSYKLVWREE